MSKPIYASFFNTLKDGQQQMWIIWITLPFATYIGDGHTSICILFWMMSHGRKKSPTCHQRLPHMMLAFSCLRLQRVTTFINMLTMTCSKLDQLWRMSIGEFATNATVANIMVVCPGQLNLRWDLSVARVTMGSQYIWDCGETSASHGDPSLSPSLDKPRSRPVFPLAHQLSLSLSPSPLLFLPPSQIAPGPRQSTSHSILALARSPCLQYSERDFTVGTSV